MFDPITFLKEECPYVTEKDFERFAQFILPPKEIKARQILIHEGETRVRTYFIAEGLLRTSIVDSKGESFTVRFAREGEIIGAHKPVLMGLPSDETVEAVENSVLLPFDFFEFKKMATEDLILMRVYCHFIEKMFIEVIQRVSRFTSKTREEHYLTLLENDPDLLLRIPQKQLASYLGITPISLSRMKKRIWEQKKMKKK